MNSNNWLSFPLSPTHSSLPPHLQTPHSSHHHHHHFSLGLVNEDNLDNPFHNHDWNLMSSHHHHGVSGGEVPKVADFLGVSKTEETQSDLAAFNDDDDTADYLFSAAPSNNGSSHLLLPLNHQNSMHMGAAATPSDDNSSINYHDLLSPATAENASTLQSLTLSMGSAGNGNVSAASTCEASCDSTSVSVVSNAAAAEAVPRRSLDTFGQRTSIYRGVTRHRWTGRYEAHLWDNSCRREGQSRKGRQVYLGGYDKEEKAARAYDMAALKYWGTSTTTNFPINHYEKELEEMKNMTRQEFVASIRRKSSGFSRGASMYRGVTRHHQHGRWQARIGRVAGNKDLYLGTFSTEEEAAQAYDIAAIKFRGLNAVTNFDMNRYDVKSILESNTLPIGGGAARRLKEAHAMETTRKREELIELGSSSTCFQYGGGSSSSSAASARLHPYAIPLNIDHHHHQQQQQTHLDHQHTLLTLQNPEMAAYHQDPLTQLQLHHHQQQAATSFLNPYTNQFYGGSNTSYNSNPALLHGLMSLGGSSSSSAEAQNNGGGGGYYGNGMMGYGSTVALPAMGNGEELALVKVDYDMPDTASGYGGGGGGWSGDSSAVQPSNGGVFTMWNDL